MCARDKGVPQRQDLPSACLPNHLCPMGRELEADFQRSSRSPVGILTVHKCR